MHNATGSAPPRASIEPVETQLTLNAPLTARLSIRILTAMLSHKAPRVDDQAANLRKAVNDIRRCFWLLGAVGDQLIADLGVTASQRSILEHLTEHGPQSVPQIAREKVVQRQSIQRLVNELRARGLVETAANPMHRRSVLIALTSEGRSIFREIQRRERPVLRRAAGALPQQKLANAAETLGELRAVLEAMIRRGQSNA